MMRDERAAPEDDSSLVIQEDQATRGKHAHRRRRYLIPLVIICLFNIGFLVLVGSLLLVPASKPTQSGVRFDNVGGKSPLEGRPAPDFTLPMLEKGGSVPGLHLADFKGRPVMLNFWVSWCEACKREAALLEKTWRSMKEQGVVFVGIDIQDSESA